jgi:hypothetical protein
VTVTDGLSFMDLQVEIGVLPLPPPYGPPGEQGPGGPPVPPAAPPALPPTGQPSPGQPRAVRPIDQARTALGTRGVVQLARVGDARVYAARRGPRRRMAVTCDLACRLDARIRSGRSGARAASVRRKRARGTPGKATVIGLPRARRRLVVDLSVRAARRPAARRVVHVR